jgi:hypothetical protein
MEPKEKYKAFQVALATFQQLRHSALLWRPQPCYLRHHDENVAPASFVILIRCAESG